MEQERVVVIGAGLSGRGYLARQLNRDQQKLIFIDRDRQLIQDLRKREAYKIFFYSNRRKPVIISGYEAFCIEEPEAARQITMASYIFLCVGAGNLGAVGKYLADRLNRKGEARHLKGIVIAENGTGNLERVRRELANYGNLITECLMFCTTSGQEGTLDIWSEEFDYLPYNGDVYEEELPFCNFKKFKNFGLWPIRKIYTYNSLSAAIAYLGALKGYEDYGKAANDRDIYLFTERLEAELNQAICAGLAISPDQQRQFSKMAKEKFRNLEIRDTVRRNARDVRRKLGKGERIIGPLRLMERYEMEESCMVQVAAAALWYGVQDGELDGPAQTGKTGMRHWVGQIPEVAETLSERQVDLILACCAKLPWKR